MNLAAIIWTLINNTTLPVYYLTVFDLNAWYVEWMPGKLSENTTSRNMFVTNFTLPIRSDLAGIKMIAVVDLKIKSILNRNKLSSNNSLNEILVNKTESNKSDIDPDFSQNATENRLHDTSLSMIFGINLNRFSNEKTRIYFFQNFYLELLVLTSVSTIKLKIRPIEQEVNFRSQFLK